MKQTSGVTALEDILYQKVLLLRAFAAICAGALFCLENNDIDAFSEKLENRQALIEAIVAQNNEFLSVLETLGEDKGIILKLSEPAAQNTIFPDWCKALRTNFLEATKLMKTCIFLNDKIKVRASDLRNNILAELNRVKTCRKINGGYRINNNTKGSIISYKSN